MTQSTLETLLKDNSPIVLRVVRRLFSAERLRSRLGTAVDCRASCKIGYVDKPISPFLLTDRELAGEIKFGTGKYCFRMPVGPARAKEMSFVEGLLESKDFVKIYDSEEGLDNLQEAYPEEL